MSLRAYVRRGPDAGGGDPKRRMVGVWLWWKVWAGIVTLLLTMLLAGWTAQQWGWMAAWLVGIWITAPLLEAIDGRGEEVSEA